MKYQKSDHYDGVKFRNPDGRGTKRFRDVMKWTREKRSRWPDHVDNRGQPDIVERHHGDDMRVTFVMHACFLIQWRGMNIITDPVYSRRCSPSQLIGPARVREPGLAFENLPPIDLVLVSHNHYDHMDAATTRRLENQFHPHFVTPLGNAKLLKNFGAAKVNELDWWRSLEVGPLKVFATPAQHWSGRGLHDRMRALWAGFFVTAETAKKKSGLFFAGDTGYGPHFKTIAKELGQPHVALLPIGAYDPRWFMGDNHMDPADAVKAHQDLGATFSLGMHFGTWQLTNEPINEPVELLAKTRAEAGVSAEHFRVLEFGETCAFAPPTA